MKKILFSILLATTLIACSNQDSKKTENSEEDKDTGTWTSLDAKTIKVRQLLESYGKNDSSIVYEIVADTVKFSDQFANNQENGVTKVNSGGREAFVQDTRNAHQLFSNISLTTDNIRTFVSKDGVTATG
jgi:ABC-type proline/glycine betaine transport system substrate-binding protein